MLGTVLRNQDDYWLTLNVEGGYLKILAVTVIVLLFSHGFDLYDSSGVGAGWDQVFRLSVCAGIRGAGAFGRRFCLPSFLPRQWVCAGGVSHPDVYAFQLARRLQLAGETAIHAGARVRAGDRGEGATIAERVAAALRTGSGSCGLDWRH